MLAWKNLDFARLWNDPYNKSDDTFKDKAVSGSWEVYHLDLQEAVPGELKSG